MFYYFFTVCLGDGARENVPSQLSKVISNDVETADSVQNESLFELKVIKVESNLFI